MAAINYKPWVNQEKQVGQAYVHASTADIRVVMAGRQSGKTMTGVVEIVYWALADSDQVLWWVVPTYKVKDKAWRDLKSLIPKEVISKTNETENRVEFKNGSLIKIMSADGTDSLVSEKLNGLVGDEAGLWKSDVWYMGLMPMFGTTKMRALFISTPRGHNWFHDLWLRGRGPGGSPVETPVVYGGVRYHSFHWTSYDSPYTNRAVIEEARRSSPQDKFMQEWLAEPMDNANAVFKDVQARISNGLLGSTEVNWIGVDLARKHDFSAFAVMNTKREVFHIERSQADWPSQKQRICHLALKYNARVVADATGLGDPVAQFLRDAGLQVEEVTLSQEKKKFVIDALRVAFEAGAITIPNDGDLVDELLAYQYEDLPNGGLRYTAPEGKHDDLVMAVALANWGARAIQMGQGSKPVTHYYLPRSRGFVNL